MTDNPVGDDGLWEIAKALEVNSTIRVLSMSVLFHFSVIHSCFSFVCFPSHIGCLIGDKGACALAEALKKNSSIETLFLYFLFILHQRPLPIYAFFKTSLDNAIGDEGACAIAEALKVNSSVTTVSLS